MDARPPGLHCHCYWLWLFPHATRETSVECLSCSWCGRCRLQEGEQGLPSVQEQQVSMFSFTSSLHECCGWPGPHLRVAAAAAVRAVVPACQPAHRCRTAPNSSRVAADLTWRFLLPCRCFKCQPMFYDPEEYISYAWVLKKDGTCVQCKDENCTKCNPNKPSQCLQCIVSAPRQQTPHLSCCW